MDMRKSWNGAMRLVAEASKIVAGTGKQIPRFARDDNQDENARDDKTNRNIEAVGETARRTVPLPSILTSGAPTLMRAGVMPKPTPANLRRFAEMPIARRAINTIKDRVAGMQWRIEPRRGRGYGNEGTQVSAQKRGANLGHPSSGESQKTHTSKSGLCGAPDVECSGSHISQRKGYVGHPFDDMEGRIALLTENFEQPNPDDSFRSMIEQVLEDVLVGGFGAIELDLTGDERRPLVMWPVDGASIRIKSDWDGNPSSLRYVQGTGQFLPNADITLADEELSYMRLNPRTHTPFGLGKLEVAFETIHEFLGAHRYAARLASNTVVQYALWLQNMTPQHHERLIRWWQDDIEGTGKVPILSVESKPEVLRFGAGTDADLRLQWQEFLIRIIADAFDLPPMVLGLERDVNRSTATTMYDEAFRTAVVPVARLVAERLTRDVISKRLGWSDLQFVFTDLDAPNELEQAQIQQILLSCGVLTVNEVRRMKGLPALEERTVAGD
jgi:Phage portal protein